MSQVRKFSASQRIKALPLGLLCAMAGDRRAAVECFTAAIAGNYEGTERTRLRRRGEMRLESGNPGFGIRDGFVSEQRALDQTFGIVGAIKEKYAQHTVGDCRLIWNTGDAAIDEAYEANWMSAMNTLDASGEHHFSKQTELVVKSVLGDGDIFGQLVSRFDANGKPTGPGQVRLIEADRVRNTPSLWDFDVPEMIGGIGLATNGQRKFYRVWERSFYGMFENSKEVTATEIVHVTNPDRVDMLRGVTAFKNAINPLRDLKETVEAEHLSAKNNSKLSLLIKTTLGAAKGPVVNLFEGDDTTVTGDGGATHVDTQSVNDATMAYMFPTEDMKAFESTRPSSGWQSLMEWRMQEIAVALHLPVAVVWKLAVGSTGPVARGDYAAASRTFAKFHFQVVWLKWIRKIAGWITARDISRGLIPAHKNWSNFSGLRPAAITIDVGRDSQSSLNEIDAGMAAMDEFFTEAGGNPSDVIRRNCRLLKKMKAEAEKPETINGKVYTLNFSDVRRPPQTTALVDTANIQAEGAAV